MSDGPKTTEDDAVEEWCKGFSDSDLRSALGVVCSEHLVLCEQLARVTRRRDAYKAELIGRGLLSPNAAVFGVDEDGGPQSYKMLARFNPKRRDDLKSHLEALIGEVVEWTFAGTGMSDEPYPGQWRWTPPYEDKRWRDATWAPDEDLEPVYV